MRGSQVSLGKVVFKIVLCWPNLAEVTISMVSREPLQDFAIRPQGAEFIYWPKQENGRCRSQGPPTELKICL